jgi:hypothetical protein
MYVDTLNFCSEERKPMPKELFRITVVERRTTIHEVEMEVDPALNRQDNVSMVEADFAGWTPKQRKACQVEELDTYWACEAESPNPYLIGQKIIEKSTGYNYSVIWHSPSCELYAIQPEDPSCPNITLSREVLDANYERP